MSFEHLEKVVFTKSVDEHSVNEGAVGRLVSLDGDAENAVVRVYGKSITVSDDDIEVEGASLSD